MMAGGHNGGLPLVLCNDGCEPVRATADIVPLSAAPTRAPRRGDRSNLFRPARQLTAFLRIRMIPDDDHVAAASRSPCWSRRSSRQPLAQPRLAEEAARSRPRHARLMSGARRHERVSRPTRASRRPAQPLALDVGWRRRGRRVALGPADVESLLVPLKHVLPVEPATRFEDISSTRWQARRLRHRGNLVTRRLVTLTALLGRNALQVPRDSSRTSDACAAISAGLRRARKAPTSSDRATQPPSNLSKRRRATAT